MAIELESTGIKVNACSPGFTKTNLSARQVSARLSWAGLPCYLDCRSDGDHGAGTNWI